MGSSPDTPTQSFWLTRALFLRALGGVYFIAFEQPWLVHLAQRLLENDPGALSLFRHNPFPDQPPRWLRMTLHEYHFTKPGSTDTWTRTRVRPYLPPVQRDNPQLLQYLRANGLEP